MTYTTKLEYVVYFEMLDYEGQPNCHEEIARFCSIERAKDYIKHCNETNKESYIRYVLEDLNAKANRR